MTKTLPAATLAVLGLLACASSALAQEEAKPAAPAGVVKLDLDETVDGKPNRDTPTTQILRKKLRELGFLVTTERPLAVDEYERKKREDAARKAGVEGASVTAAPEADPKLPPDLVIKGTVDVKLGRTSVFYGQNVAHIYVAEGKLSVQDAQGKELAPIAESDEWGRTEARAARDETIKRIAGWVTAAVLKLDAVRGRLDEKGRATADKYVEFVAKKRERRADGGPGGDSSGAAPQGGSGK